MHLARAIHFDDSDMNVFANPARTGEWCISGGFEFSNWSDRDLIGKQRQAFANGWMGLETGGRVTFVAVTQIERHELDLVTELLSHHFIQSYGAPGPAAARPVAEEELSHMLELCEDHAANTLLTVARVLTEAGVKESYRMIEPQSAGLDHFAVHVTPDS